MPAAAMHDCHICCEEVNLLLINRVHTCTTCINKLMRPVVNGSAMYPVMINNEPADLTAHGRYLSRSLFDRYAQMEAQESCLFFHIEASLRQVSNRIGCLQFEAQARVPFHKAARRLSCMV
ncbi:hypothetical protein Q7P36_008868 [Cladosporium allicinum]